MNESSNASNRSLVNSSRESSIQRYACINTAGPRYLSADHQYDGQEVEQYAHKMHSYMPSSFFLSSLFCKCSLLGSLASGALTFNQGSML